MLRPLNLVLGCLLLFCQLTYSQVKSFPGYYINNNGDSVSCVFEFHDRQVTPKKIIANVQGKTITLAPSDIKRFVVSGYGEYISASISYHLSEISEARLTENYSDSIESSQCFVKVVNPGRYSLYELTLPQRSWYFVSEDSGPLSELIFRVRKTDLKIEEDTRYRNTLFDLMVRENIQHTNVLQLSRTRYIARDINAIINKLNAKYPITKPAVKKQKEIEMDVYVGSIHNYFPSGFYGRYSAGNRFEGSASISGGINLVFVLPANFKRFAFGVSAGYNSYKSTTAASGSFTDSASANWHSTTTFAEQFSIENKLILLNLYGRYAINPLNKIKFYVKAGLNCNISLGKNDGMSTKYTAERKGVRNGNIPIYDLSEGGGNFMQHLGMFYNLRGDIGMISGRHKLEFAYFTPVALNSKAPFEIGMIGAHYYYTIFR